MDNPKHEPPNDAGVVSVDMKLEVVVIPVSDVDHARAQRYRPVAVLTLCGSRHPTCCGAQTSLM